MLKCIPSSLKALKHAEPSQQSLMSGGLAAEQDIVIHRRCVGAAADTPLLEAFVKISDGYDVVVPAGRSAAEQEVMLREGFGVPRTTRGNFRVRVAAGFNEA